MTTAMIKSATPETIKEAADIIKQGGLVGMPTETVYGLAANALNGKAVARIFEAKGRPSFNPLITHVANIEEAQLYGELPEDALTLAQTFWPGPLTMIVQRRKGCPISELVTAGLDTIALRVPAHKTARALISTSGCPIAAPSANVSGRISSTTPKHVAEQLGDKLDIILADGQSKVGLESTVIDMSGDKAVLLRYGAVTAEDLEPYIGKVSMIEKADKIKSPGMLIKHYAPSIPVRLGAVDVKKGEALLGFGQTKFMGIEGGGFAKDLPEESYKNLSEAGDLTEAAANLFAMMHALDNNANQGIAVMNIPDTGLGLAINDRLKRASAGAAK